MDKYFGNGNKPLSDIFAERTVDSEVSYLLPVLDSLPQDFVFLDVGCGPASITLDIARRYPLATILGVDQAGAIQEARKNAKKAGITNIRFAVGDGMRMAAIADTPGFEAVLGGCDVVHTHQVLLHVQDPLYMMRQLRSAAKPHGGYVCCREADMGMAAMWPSTTPLEDMLANVRKTWRGRGQDPFVGRKLLMHSLEAGFKKEDCHSSMTALIYDTLKTRQQLAYMIMITAKEGGFESVYEQDLLDWIESDNAIYAMPSAQIVCQRND